MKKLRPPSPALFTSLWGFGVRCVLVALVGWGGLSIDAWGQGNVADLNYPAAERHELVDWDEAWLFWADNVAPPNWPLTELPLSREASDLLPEKAGALGVALKNSTQAETDRVLLLRSETDGLRTSGSWWSGFLAPFSAVSEPRWVSAYDAWEESRAYHLRRKKRRFSRSQMVFPVGAEVSAPTGQVELPHQASAEPGLTNLYFVRTFQVEDPSQYKALQIQARFNKGIQVFINGVPVAKERLSSGHAHGDPGVDLDLPDFMIQNIKATDRWEYHWDALSADVLKKGENIISAVVHKPRFGESPALYFDLKLRGWEAADWTILPYLQTVTRTGVTVSWETTTLTRGRVNILNGENKRIASVPSDTPSAYHEVVVGGLEPNTAYRYQVVVDSEGADSWKSETQPFTTAPQENADFSFLFYGDSRWGVDIHRMLADLMAKDQQKHGSNVVLHAGDIVTKGYSLDLWYDGFFAPAHPLISRVPIYPSVGNHEVNQKLYYDYYGLPNNESWYHFRYGMADFYALNTNVDYSPGSEQYAWADKTLSESTAPWKVAFFHHPPFACATSRKPGDVEVQKHLVPLLEKHGVDLVLLGHDHLYGRSRKVNGVTYVISGGGGSPLYSSTTDDIMEFCEKRYNYVRFHVSEESIRWVAIDEVGEVIEEYQIQP